MLRNALFLSAATCALSCFSSAWAQPSAATAAPPGPPSASVPTGTGSEGVGPAARIPRTSAPGVQTPVAGAQAPTTQLQEIVVTAEKRQNTAQKTAASLDVVSSDTFARQNIVQITDLNVALPSAKINPIVNSVQVSIRGIGSTFVDPRADPAVAVSVNGLFFDRPLPYGFAFLDVSRVEDLNGPAGTLYGRNAAGGAINIVTNQPTSTFGGVVSAEGGNYGENNFTGVLNIPLTDTLDARIAYGRDRRDGYIGGYYDDINSDTGRASFRWRPTDKLTIYGEADYQHQGGHGSAEEYYPCGNSQPYSLSVPAGCAGLLRFKPGTISDKGHTDNHINAFQLHADYDLGWATATSISGFVGTHDRFNLLPNGVILAVNGTDNLDYTEEVRLTGHDSASHQGGLAWQVGSFFFFSDGNYTNTVITPLQHSTNAFPRLPQSSEAGFAQATYGVTDRLRLTGGVRYTHDFKGLTNVSSFNGVPVSSRLSTDDYRTTYKGGIEYDLAARNLLYANIATGYVAGGPDGGDRALPLAAYNAPVIFLPETTTEYELGSKNRFLNNRLQINGDVYYSYTRNVQETNSAYLNNVPPVVPNFALVVENIGSLSSYGVELNGTLAVTPADRLSASLTYAQGTYGSAPFRGTTPTLAPTVFNIPAGETAIDVPAYTGLLGYEHTWNFNGGDTLVFSANSKLSTRYHLVIASSNSDDIQPAFTSTDLGLSYTLHRSNVVLRGYVKNLEDKAVNVYGEAPGQNVYGVLPPRTYGGSVTVSF